MHQNLEYEIQILSTAKYSIKKLFLSYLPTSILLLKKRDLGASHLDKLIESQLSYQDMEAYDSNY